MPERRSLPKGRIKAAKLGSCYELASGVTSLYKFTGESLSLILAFADTWFHFVWGSCLTINTDFSLFFFFELLLNMSLQCDIFAVQYDQNRYLMF